MPCGKLLVGSIPTASAKANIDGLRAYVVQSAWFAITVCLYSTIGSAADL